MKNIQKEQNKRRVLRVRRVRARMHGDAQKPRLCVTRSLRYLQAQLIDDDKGVTLFGATDRVGKYTGTKQERAHAFGKDFAERAVQNNIKKVVFDRGCRSYRGRIEAFARGAREGGLVF